MKHVKAVQLQVEMPADWELRLHEAMRETTRLIEAGATSGDPSLPVFVVASEWELEKERMRFERGDKMALLAAVRVCANHDMPLPEWASRAFIRAYDTILNCRIGSWDDAFGRPYRKGVHLAALRKRRKLRMKVWLDVNAELKKSSRAVDESLFEDIGRPLGLGKTLTAEMYYEARNMTKWSEEG